MKVFTGILKDLSRSRSCSSREDDGPSKLKINHQLSSSDYQCLVYSFTSMCIYLLCQMFEVIKFGAICCLLRLNYLENGVHGDCQWATPRILRDLKDVNTPSIYILKLLSVNKHE